MLIHEGTTFPINIGEIGQVKAVSFLGSGGFADVWKVQDTSTLKEYVVKRIQVKPTVKDRDKFIQRIKNEASVSIPSEFIVPSLGLVELAENTYGIVFPYIKGEALNDWIYENKKTPWATKRALFLKIAKGVGHAHALNILHRDLKPQNILVTPDGEPKIIDFGLAKFKDRSVSVTDAGEIFGTFPYMDPEVFLNGVKYVDCQCDIYALGVILYEIIMGYNFWTTNDIEFGGFVREIQGGKSDILDIDSKFSFTEDAKIKDIIRKSTKFESENRTKDVEDLLNQLGDYTIEKPSFKVDFSITSPVLVVEDGSAKGAMNMITIPDGGQRALGRLNLDSTNNTISKNHAVISRKGNQYFIHDAGSTNGTFVKGIKLKGGQANAVEIKHTDRVRFADLWTRFVFLKKG